MLQRLLLLPLLLPLLAVLLLGAINPRPATSLRLLIWTSPTLPIGLWITAAAAGGAALSAGATALALKGQSRVVFQRQRRGLEPGAQPEPWDLPRSEPSRRREAPAEAYERGRPFAAAAATGPVRAAGDPAPTVAVPFRVIHRADPGVGAARTSAAATSPAAAAAGAAVTAAAGAGGDGWDEAQSDDW